MANLYYGSSGDEVKTLQDNLNKVGNYGLDVDGAYGPKTQAAVRDYQTKNNLTIDGIYGDQTRTSLDTALAKLNPTTAQPTAQTQTAAAPTVQGPTAAQTAAVSGTSAVPPSTLAQTISGIKVTGPDVPDAPDLRPELEQWLAAAQAQAQNQVDYATQTGINELQRAYEDALPQYQQMRDQVSAEEAKALDNQALYAEARGDRGGIGQAQYNSIMNNAAQNRLQVNQAQTKLATDTSRGIADLRAKGEYEKADKLLELTQTYLSQLMSLEQWAANYNLDAAQFKWSIEQWQAEFEMQAAQVLEDQRQWEYGAAQDRDKTLASAGEALLSAGIMPSDSQLAAMGFTKEQAQQYIAAIQLQQAYGGSGSGGSSGGSSRRSSGGGGGSGSGVDSSAGNAGLSTDKVKEIQKFLGVGVDGQAGPQTYAAMYELGFTDINELYAWMLAQRSVRTAAGAVGSVVGAVGSALGNGRSGSGSGSGYTPPGSANLGKGGSSGGRKIIKPGQPNTGMYE